MLWWKKTDFSVKPQFITIIFSLVHTLIHHNGDFLVVQPFL